MQFELVFGSEPPVQSDEHWLRVGARSVRLRWVRHRRARRYVLRLCPDGAARVTIPRGGSIEEAGRFVKRNLAWLEKQFLRQAAQPAGPGKWPAGAELLFRGERVRLEVEGAGGAGRPKSEGRNPSQIQREGNDKNGVAEPGQRGVVRFGGEVLAVADVSGDLRPAVERHLREMALRELPSRALELAALHQLPMRRVTVRNQRSRWGSCSRRGTISLNWRLIQTPAFVRDYIVLHELAHLKEMNHSRRFWREVAQLCPEFAQAERWLKQHGDLMR